MKIDHSKFKHYVVECAGYNVMTHSFENAQDYYKKANGHSTIYGVLKDGERQFIKGK